MPNAKFDTAELRLILLCWASTVTVTPALESWVRSVSKWASEVRGSSSESESILLQPAQLELWTRKAVLFTSPWHRRSIYSKLARFKSRRYLGGSPSCVVTVTLTVSAFWPSNIPDLRL
jgi:hypothetical protein